MISPLKKLKNQIGAEAFLGVGGIVGKKYIDAFKNRKEHGGGISGMIKAGGEELGFGDKDKALSEINSKLDTLLGGEGGEIQDTAVEPIFIVTQHEKQTYGLDFRIVPKGMAKYGPNAKGINIKYSDVFKSKISYGTRHKENNRTRVS